MGNRIENCQQLRCRPTRRIDRQHPQCDNVDRPIFIQSRWFRFPPEERHQYHPRLLRPSKTRHILRKPIQVHITVLERQGTRAHRKFLEDGYLPTDPAMRDCLFCGCQGTVDEPNTNLQAVQNNILIHHRHQGQLAQDNQAWARGEQVLTNRGTVMQQGRARNAPKFENLIMNCHATQFGCTIRERFVPIVECPIRCINKDTGARYGTDPTTGE